MSYTEMHAYFYPVMFTPETQRGLQRLESLDPSKSQDVASGSTRPASWLPTPAPAPHSPQRETAGVSY